MSRIEFGAGGLISRKNEATNPGSSVSISNAASTAVVAENPQRVALILGNDQANTIYVRLAATGAVISSGIMLRQGAMIILEGYTGPACAWGAGGAPSPLLVTEL